MLSGPLPLRECCLRKDMQDLEGVEMAFL